MAVLANEVNYLLSKPSGGGSELESTWGGLSVRDGYIQLSVVPPSFCDAGGSHGMKTPIMAKGPAAGMKYEITGFNSDADERLAERATMQASADQQGARKAGVHWRTGGPFSRTGIDRSR